MSITDIALPPPARLTTGHVYVRPPEPIEFPAFESPEEPVSETKRHLENRTALYLVLKKFFAATCSIGSDQFVYHDPTDARRCLSPDAFVKLDVADRPFSVWKTWERGAPELGVEIISASDQRDEDWADKLARYRAAGVREIVRFDAEDRERPIRIWDHLSGDVVERAPGDPDLRFCHALGLWWVVLDDPTYGPMLRLARDREGRDPLPTPEERSALAEQTLRDETEARRRAEGEIERLKEALAKACRGE
jgi:Uma2 family endonuclease